MSGGNLSGVYHFYIMLLPQQPWYKYISESTVVLLARAVSPTNTNFWLTFLLTQLQEALYEDLAV